MAAILTQVGHFYFGEVGQFYIGADTQGAYRFTTNTTGTCQLHYHGLGIEASTTVVLYDDPVTYDFAVERSASGPRLVRR